MSTLSTVLTHFNLKHKTQKTSQVGKFCFSHIENCSVSNKKGQSVHSKGIYSYLGGEENAIENISKWHKSERKSRF